jgi:formylglycine-generating enzyme required for sulfatase activity
MEWVLDSHDPSTRVLKGGAWDTFVEINARPEFRWYAPPGEAKNSYGFRVILSGP